MVAQATNLKRGTIVIIRVLLGYLSRTWLWIPGGTGSHSDGSHFLHKSSSRGKRMLPQDGAWGRTRNGEEIGLFDSAHTGARMQPWTKEATGHVTA